MQKIRYNEPGRVDRIAQATAPGRPGRRTGLSLRMTGAGIIGNMLVGMGKLMLGLGSLSAFTCISALYTFAMVAAKCCALAGILKGQEEKSQLRSYTLCGIVLRRILSRCFMSVWQKIS